MFRRILVTLDGSEFAEAALGMAVGVARKSGAALRLVSVHDTGWTLVDGEWGGAARALGRYLDGKREEIEPLWSEVSTAHREGVVVDGVLAEADEFGADLIVMATHGRGPISRFWLGSVADQLVRRAHRPVLLVRPGPEAGAKPIAAKTVLRMVVPVDGSELAERALGPAMTLAHVFGCPIGFLRVVQDPTAIASDLYPESVAAVRQMFEESYDEATGYLGRLAESVRAWGIALTTRAAVAQKVPDAILEEAGTDLVVMATHARAGLNRAFLGSVSDAVVRSAHGPVLLVPPELQGALGSPAPANEARLAESAKPF